MQLLELPIDVLIPIFNQLDDTTRNSLFIVSRLTRTIITENYLTNLYGRSFGFKAFLREQSNRLKSDIDKYYEDQSFEYSGIIMGHPDLRSSQRCRCCNKVTYYGPEALIVSGIIMIIMFFIVISDKLFEKGFFSLHTLMVFGSPTALICLGINKCIERHFTNVFNEQLTEHRLTLNADRNTAEDVVAIYNKNPLFSFFVQRDKQTFATIQTNRDVKDYLESKKTEMKNILNTFETYHKSLAGSKTRAIDIDSLTGVSESPIENTITFINKEVFVFLIKQWNERQDPEKNSQMIIDYKYKMM